VQRVAIPLAELILVILPDAPAAAAHPTHVPQLLGVVLYTHNKVVLVLEAKAASDVAIVVVEDEAVDLTVVVLVVEEVAVADALSRPLMYQNSST
jgi:hypothetical protein